MRKRRPAFGSSAFHGLPVLGRSAILAFILLHSPDVNAKEAADTTYRPVGSRTPFIIGPNDGGTRSIPPILFVHGRALKGKRCPDPTCHGVN